MRGRPLLVPQFLQCLKRGDVVALTLLGAGPSISSSENTRVSAASVLHFLRVCGLKRLVGKVKSRIRGSKVIPAKRLRIVGPVMNLLHDQRGNESKSWQYGQFNSYGRGGDDKVWFGYYVLRRFGLYSAMQLLLKRQDLVPCLPHLQLCLLYILFLCARIVIQQIAPCIHAKTGRTTDVDCERPGLPESQVPAPASLSVFLSRLSPPSLARPPPGMMMGVSSVSSQLRPLRHAILYKEKGTTPLDSKGHCKESMTD
jgi:hypothetical protein